MISYSSTHLGARVQVWPFHFCACLKRRIFMTKGRNLTNYQKIATLLQLKNVTQTLNVMLELFPEFASLMKIPFCKNIINCRIQQKTSPHLIFQKYFPIFGIKHYHSHLPAFLQRGPPAAWWASVHLEGLCTGLWSGRTLGQGGSSPTWWRSSSAQLRAHL